jgi:cellulose synthase operon protein C
LRGANLRARGVDDSKLAQQVVRQVGGSPLSLKLAADLVEQEGRAGGKLDLGTRERLFSRIDDRIVQRQLYRRVLDHVHDPEVRRLAHLGIVLLRLTPELILEVLAQPCGLSVATLDDAQRLVDALPRESRS